MHEPLALIYELHKLGGLKLGKVIALVLTLS